jgi:hypothetical protein
MHAIRSVSCIHWVSVHACDLPCVLNACMRSALVLHPLGECTCDPPCIHWLSQHAICPEVAVKHQQGLCGGIEQHHLVGVIPPVGLPCRAYTWLALAMVVMVACGSDKVHHSEHVATWAVVHG